MEYADMISLGFLVLPIIGFILSSMRILITSKVYEKLFIPILSISVVAAEFVLALLINIEVNINGKLYFSIDNLAVDSLSAILLIIVQGLYLVIALFSLYYFSPEKYGNYFTLFFVLDLGLILSLCSDNLFVLFISWELMVLTGYILVVFSQTKKAYEAGIKYLVISSFGSLEILFGLGLLTASVSSLDYDDLLVHGGIMDTFLGKFAFAFIIMGFGVTAGMIFLNQWLPDAHPEAPSPVSAILSGIVVKIGIYALYRCFMLLAPDSLFSSSASQLMIIIAILTMSEGNIMVFAQFMRNDITDFKRILAYSTTVHLGFLLLVVPIQSEFTKYALLFHIANHGLAKVMLFLLSGYIITRYGTRDLKKLRGIGSKDKLLGLSLFIGLMSLGGLPGTGGFVSKLMIILSFYQRHEFMGPLSTTFNISLILILLNSVLAFIGYLWMIKYLIFDKTNENQVINDESKLTWLARIVLIALILAILILGFMPGISWQL
ncbi:MAG: NADH dehydrogenase [Candidatus Heimdallarchaeota archaeon]|nr:NADH dehydrogenase [Candidatus Heimdallarchaeota archaeon]